VIQMQSLFHSILHIITIPTVYNLSFS